MIWRNLGTRRVEKALDTLLTRIATLEAEVHRLDMEWADSKDQLRRSYQRLEKAGERLARRSNGTEPMSPCDEAAQALTEASPGEKLLRLMRKDHAVSE